MNAETLIQQIHESPMRLVLAVAGGGSGAVAQMLAVPGASRTLLEAIIPYADAPLTDLLGGPVDQHCSEPTARAMAMAAFQRGLRWMAAGAAAPADHAALPPGEDAAPGGAHAEPAKREPAPRERAEPTAAPQPIQADTPEHVEAAAPDAKAFALAGVACTAALATDRPRRGRHRAFVAVQTADFTHTAWLELEKGRRARREEELLVARLILSEIALACRIDGRLELALAPTEHVERHTTLARPGWRDLLLGRLDAVCWGGGGHDPERPSSGVVFPGAFNPLHEGHRQMAQVAERLLGRPVEFEISIRNVDKPPLDYVEIQRRVAPFPPQAALWLTRAATFVEKAALFPGATFVVGCDTLVRIADPRYYGGSAAERDAALAKIAACGCRFLVFGRVLGQRFATLGGVKIPSLLAGLCEEVPEESFRADISSTLLRRHSKG